MSIVAVSKNIGEDVFEQMRDQIVSGQWSNGAKIPNEFELMEMFQVSRVSIRQAIQRLVGMGLLTIKRGDGTYVNEINAASQLSASVPIIMLNKAELMEIMEFRKIIETENAKLAAERGTEEDKIKLRELYESMLNDKGDLAAYARHDTEFHTLIANVTHNSIIQEMTTLIHGVLDKMMFEGVSIVGFAVSMKYHEKILNAIETGDPKLARKAMKDHINNIITTFLGSDL